VGPRTPRPPELNDGSSSQRRRLVFSLVSGIAWRIICGLALSFASRLARALRYRNAVVIWREMVGLYMVRPAQNFSTSRGLTATHCVMHFAIGQILGGAPVERYATSPTGTDRPDAPQAKWRSANPVSARNTSLDVGTYSAGRWGKLNRGARVATVSRIKSLALSSEMITFSLLH